MQPDRSLSCKLFYCLWFREDFFVEIIDRLLSVMSFLFSSVMCSHFTAPFSRFFIFPWYKHRWYLKFLFHLSFGAVAPKWGRLCNCGFSNPSLVPPNEPGLPQRIPRSPVMVLGNKIFVKGVFLQSGEVTIELPLVLFPDPLRSGEDGKGNPGPSADNLRLCDFDIILPNHPITV